MADNEIYEAEAYVSEPVQEGYQISVASNDKKPEAVRALEEGMLQLKLQWEKEKAERTKWKLEDIRMQGYLRMIAIIAGGALGEGAVGSRPNKRQIAEMSRDIADEIMASISKRPPLWLIQDPSGG